MGSRGGRGSRPVSRVLSRAAIHLGCTSPCTSSDLPGNPCGPHVAEESACSPIWSCSGWGLPCHRCCHRRGALLPHHFTLTDPRQAGVGGMFSVALSVGSRPPGVTWHPALRSPDFPPPRQARGSGCLADSHRQCTTVRSLPDCHRKYAWPIQYVRVHHALGCIGISQQLRHRTDVIPGVREMGCS